MLDERLQSEAMASAHAAFALSRSHAALLELAKTDPENSVVYGSLFLAATSHYCAAFERQTYKGHSFTPSVRRAPHYDKDTHKFLMVFRQKLGAHHVNDFHKRNIMFILGTTKDELGNDVDHITIPVVAQTTTVAPISKTLVDRITIHIYRVAAYHTERSRVLLRELALKTDFDEVLSDPEITFFGGNSGEITLEDTDAPDKKRFHIPVPADAFRTLPPLVGENAEDFLRLSLRLVGHDGTMEHSILASFETFPLSPT